MEGKDLIEFIYYNAPRRECAEKLMQEHECQIKADVIHEVMEYTFGMVDAEKFLLQQHLVSMLEKIKGEKK